MRSVLTFILCVTLSTCSFADTSLKYGMVVSADKTASQVGLDILKQGGNAIDAAVALGYALAVTFPCCGNIGGGGFMTIHLASGENVFINFRETAPLKSKQDMFDKIDKKNSTDSFLAIAVPGTVLGFEKVLKEYGTMSQEQVLKPAIQLAKQGYKVTDRDAWLFNLYAEDFARHPNVARIYLKNGKSYQAGDILRQPELAATLQLIANKGSHAFYQGSIARKIVSASEQHGGILSMQDFANYKVQILNPIQCHYRGYTIISAPPPSSGGVTLCEALNILENFPLSRLAYGNPLSTHLIIEAMNYSFKDRNMKLGDPDFVTNPVKELTSKKYANQIAKQIIKNTPGKQDEPGSAKEAMQTTHYSVIDAKGNAVSVTYTLNGFFGSRLIASDTGFFLNNEMDDFAARIGKPNKFGLIQNEANAIQAGKRPLSSMTPTLVFKNNQLYLVIGSPGGPRIITALLLALINHLDYGFSIQNAINLPRYHFQHQPDEIFIEPSAISLLTQTQLLLMGHRFKTSPTWGAVEAILINPENGEVTGANDMRRPNGAALGE